LLRLLLLSLLLLLLLLLHQMRHHQFLKSVCCMLQVFPQYEEAVAPPDEAALLGEWMACQQCLKLL
jgi:hypothetical protein